MAGVPDRRTVPAFVLSKKNCKQFFLHRVISIRWNEVDGSVGFYWVLLGFTGFS